MIKTIADDITGAAEMAAVWAEKESVFIHWPAQHIPHAVLNLGMRYMSNAQSASYLKTLPAPRYLENSVPQDLFIKIDAYLRGPVVPLIKWASAFFHPDAAVICPVLPDRHLAVRHRRLWVENEPLENIPAAQPQERQTPLDLTILAQTLWPHAPIFEACDHADLSSMAVFIPDAMHWDDVSHCIHPLRTTYRRILWIGAGGLMESLAQTHPKILESTQWPATASIRVAVGSPHETAHLQMRRLSQNYPLFSIKNDRRYSNLPRISLFTDQDQTAITPEERRIQWHRWARSQPISSKPTLWILTGGDTAD
ncbi:MAG: hypothetical protein OWS74_01330, partial [Firmicutes bacterium]|nr:hypothetical protein [Bacillota bacterium]